jgi:hypothetical protein
MTRNKMSGSAGRPEYGSDFAIEAEIGRLPDLGIDKLRARWKARYG